MMMDVRNLPWIGAGLTVVAAADASLIGRQGHVIGETRNTIHLLEGCLLYTSDAADE
mgnify:CR=1 FL=1